MPKVIEGVVRDGRIVLSGGAELEDGQRVQVVMESPHVLTGSPDVPPAPEEGTVYTEVDDPDLIEFLAGIRGDRAPLPPGPGGQGRESAAGKLADDPTWDEHLREVLDARRSAIDCGRAG